MLCDEALCHKYGSWSLMLKHIRGWKKCIWIQFGSWHLCFGWFLCDSILHDKTHSLEDEFVRVPCSLILSLCSYLDVVNAKAITLALAFDSQLLCVAFLFFPETLSTSKVLCYVVCQWYRHVIWLHLHPEISPCGSKLRTLCGLLVVSKALFQ